MIVFKRFFKQKFEVVKCSTQQMFAGKHRNAITTSFEKAGKIHGKATSVVFRIFKDLEMNETPYTSFKCCEMHKSWIVNQEERKDVLLVHN